MPWHIEKRADEFCVVRDSDDTIVGNHPSRPEAIQQLRSLYSSDDTIVAAGMTIAEVPSKNTVDDEDDDDKKKKKKVVLPAYATAPWEGVLTMEGVESGDGRRFAENSLTWDVVAPEGMPLMWQKVTSHGGSGDESVRVGTIKHAWRVPDPAGRPGVNMIMGRGLIDLANEDGKEAYRRMKAGMMSGNSVDVDSVKDANIEFVYDDKVNDDGEGASPVALMSKPTLTIYHKGRIRGTTLVEYPAFTEARLSLMDEDDITAAAIIAETSSDMSEEAYDQLAEKFRADGQEPPSYDVVSDRLSALTAASHSITLSDLPPREWFQEPTDVSPLGALTITDKGRVYGYVAPADVRHRSFPDKMQYAPRKKVDYSRFMSGETIVADGGRVATGPITMNCGHATTAYSLTSTQAQEHYDNSCSIIASVVVGETKEGATWFAGALLKDVEPHTVQRAMACKLSGDWRAHLDKPGWRELTAALLVPVPGFPMARVAPSVRFEEGQLVSSAVPVRFIHDDEEPVVAASVPVTANLANRVAALKLRVKTFRFDPGQKRDDHGRWTDDELGKLKDYAKTLGKKLPDDTHFTGPKKSTSDGDEGPSASDNRRRLHQLEMKSEGDEGLSGDEARERDQLRKTVNSTNHLTGNDEANKRRLELLERMAESEDGISGEDADELRELREMVNGAPKTSNLLSGVDLSVDIPRNDDGDRVWKAGEVNFDDLVRDGMQPGDKYVAYWGPDDVHVETFDPREHYVGGDIPPELTSAAFVRFADINTKTRKALAEKGQALPDGSYPIRNVSDLHNAIQAYGRSNPEDRVKVRRHIMKRAKQLGNYDVIPKEWITAESQAAIVMRIKKSIGHDPATRVAELRARVSATADVDTFKFNPKQARDSHGRWTDSGAKVGDVVTIGSKAAHTGDKIHTTHGPVIKETKTHVHVRDSNVDTGGGQGYSAIPKKNIESVTKHDKSILDKSGVKVGDTVTVESTASHTGDKIHITHGPIIGETKTHVHIRDSHIDTGGGQGYSAIPKKNIKGITKQTSAHSSDSHADRHGPTVADNKRRLAELDDKAESDEGLSSAEASERSQLRKTLKMTQTDKGRSISREEAARIMYGG